MKIIANESKAVENERVSYDCQVRALGVYFHNQFSETEIQGIVIDNVKYRTPKAITTAWGGRDSFTKF